MKRERRKDKLITDSTNARVEGSYDKIYGIGQRAVRSRVKESASSTTQAHLANDPPLVRRSRSASYQDQTSGTDRKLTPKKPLLLPLPPTCTPSNLHLSAPPYLITKVHLT